MNSGSHSDWASTPKEWASRDSREHNLPSQRSTDSPKRRTRWIWGVVLLLFALLFVVVLRHRETAAAGAQTGGRHMMMGPVPVATATAKLGGVGVYVEAIGTVTPIYTDSIAAQVTGHITAVRYREGQFVHKGDPLIDLDARPYEAQLEQAQGTLEHDQQVLAEAQMDLERYKQAWARHGIPRQTLEDQEKVVLQDHG